MSRHAELRCEHCATPFPRKAGGDTRFCCAGCRYVYRMIREGGLDQFYDIKGRAQTRPVESLAFEVRDYAWLEDMVAGAEAAEEEGNPARLELSVTGISCAACVWLLESVFAREPGAIAMHTDAAQGRAVLSWRKGGCSVVDAVRRLQGFGYEFGPPGEQGDGAAGLGQRLGLCAAFAMNAMAFTLPRYLGMPPEFSLAGVFEMVAAVSAALAMLLGGSYFIARSVRALRHGMVHIDLPIALGVTLAFGGSLFGWVAGYEPLLYFDFVAVFVFLMLGGRWLQERSLARNRNRLAERYGHPDTFRPADGAPARPLEQLEPGGAYRLRAGELVPVASTVVEESRFGMAWISGEADDQAIPAGGIAPSGSVYLGEGETSLVAREAWAGSVLQRLVHQPAPGEMQDRGLRGLIAGYIGLVIIVGLSAAVWWFARTGDVGRALQVAISLFVVSCPCALGVALPLADRIASARAARSGAYPQRRGFWGRLARTRKVIFDKTGTLTLGRPVLVDRGDLDSLGADALAALSAITSASPHPVSRALFGEVAALGAVRGAGDIEVTEEVGVGVRARVGGVLWSLERDPDAGSDALFTRDGQVEARFTFADSLRPSAAAEVAMLGKMGVEVFLMSGDRADKVRAVAHQLGMTEGRWGARMSPDEKAGRVARLDRRDTLFVGDGANDSLAFDAAHCTATPVDDFGLLQGKADLYFLGRSLGWLGEVIAIARRRRLAIRSVVAFALTYNLCAAGVALAGGMNPLLAAVLMPLSSVVTVALTAGLLAAGGRRPAPGGEVSPRRADRLGDHLHLPLADAGLLRETGPAGER